MLSTRTTLPRPTPDTGAAARPSTTSGTSWGAAQPCASRRSAAVEMHDGNAAGGPAVAAANLRSFPGPGALAAALTCRGTEIHTFPRIEVVVIAPSWFPSARRFAHCRKPHFR